MRICIIGSSQYRNKMEIYRDKLTRQGHSVLIPAFDDHPDLDDLGVCKYNRQKISEADRIDIIWDARSIGTIFDFGQAFALHKPIKIIYINDKTFTNVMRKYEKENANVL